jgi:hypothetical protein
MNPSDTERQQLITLRNGALAADPVQDIKARRDDEAVSG